MSGADGKRQGAVVAVIAVAATGLLATAFFARRAFSRRTRASASASLSVQEQMARLGPGNPDSPRIRLLVGPDDVVFGPPTALVTLVEFVDFQSVFDRKAAAALRAVRETFGNDLRIVVKQLPNNDLRPYAFESAESVLAAHAQGKFWPYHDLLFENQDALDRTWRETYAERLGLDVGKFRRALDEHTFEPQISRDIALARQSGVWTTPTMIVNGQKVTGPLSAEMLKKWIENELRHARRVMDKRGVPASEVYLEIMRGARVPEPLPERQHHAPVALPTPDPAKRYRVPVGASPVRGAAHALLTIVEFSDEESPSTASLLSEIDRRFHDDVRFVYESFPQPTHAGAWQAAEADLEAHAQGKFWLFHQELLSRSRRESAPLDRALLERAAKASGLELARFRDALEKHAHTAEVRGEFDLAQTLGLWDTSHLFINGRHVRADASADRVLSLCEQELARAKRLGPARTGEPYEQLLAGAEPWVIPPDRPESETRPGPQSGVVYRVGIDEDDPTLGARAAKATLVVFFDYTSPFAAKLDTVLRQAVNANPQERRVVLKQLPARGSVDATRAAEAALEAKAQGKFWEFHERLLSSPTAWDTASLAAKATQAGLDRAAFESALESGRHRPKVARDVALAERLGLHSGLFVLLNGQAVTNAFMPKTLEQQIVAAGAAADSLRAKGIAPERLYEAIVAKGLAEAKPPPQSDRRYEIVAGASPAVGPPKAPVQMIEFSDFECGFSQSSVLPLKRLLWSFPRDVRIVFKNLPHKSTLAAEAAMAAHDQGKFWEMHDRIFQEQKFDGASLERFAADLGLDGERFRSGLDQRKYEDMVKQDTDLASSLGIQGTPTFFINGRKVDGAVSFSRLRAMVEEELGHARERKRAP